jgi:uncharacterized membrane protein
MDKNIWLILGAIITVFSLLTVTLQMRRKKYFEATLNLIYAIGLAGFFLSIYFSSVTAIYVFLILIVPVTLVQAIHSHRKYKKSKEAK